MRIEILVLGLLLEANLYGYEIKKILLERLNGYSDIKFGSIYYALQKGIDNGWIKCVGTEKNELSPERYVYQILPEGKKYYKKLLKRYLDDTKMHFDIDIILMFLNSLDPEDKGIFISDRKELLKSKIAEIKGKIDAEEKKKEKKNFYIYTYIENHLKAELNWIRSLE
jgi:DNA-binding PadR family transcriptional regulator